MTPTPLPPARYWRESKNWASKLGRRGKVIAVTTVNLGLPELEDHLPYSLILVKHENNDLQLYMGGDGYEFKAGDQVKCVLRKISSQEKGLIHYGIKVIPF